MIHPWGGYYFSIFFINKFFESPPIKRLQNICLKMNFSFRNQFHRNPNKINPKNQFPNSKFTDRNFPRTWRIFSLHVSNFNFTCQKKNNVKFSRKRENRVDPIDRRRMDFTKRSVGDVNNSLIIHSDVVCAILWHRKLDGSLARNQFPAHFSACRSLRAGCATRVVAPTDPTTTCRRRVFVWAPRASNRVDGIMIGGPPPLPFCQLS